VFVVVLWIVFIDHAQFWEFKVPFKIKRAGILGKWSKMNRPRLLDNVIDTKILPPFLVGDKHFFRLGYIELARTQEPDIR
jgi:hypothetical protein